MPCPADHFVERLADHFPARQVAIDVVDDAPRAELHTTRRVSGFDRLGHLAVTMFSARDFNLTDGVDGTARSCCSPVVRRSSRKPFSAAWRFSAAQSMIRFANGAEGIFLSLSSGFIAASERAPHPIPGSPISRPLRHTRV
jgi:hypothetical protein